MAESRTITILGGGLAGLTLGIGLRREDVPVTICEAGHYPRQRVCGEFISGRGQQALSRLGLDSLLAEAGAIPARTVAFFSATQSSPSRSLPAPAVCLSRWQLDARLADQFRRLGGDLQAGRRLDPENSAEGSVRANGRRLAENGREPRWFGLKIHARNVLLRADLEMHVSPLGYVGLCRVENGEVNICGLFHRRMSCRTQPTEPRELLRGLPGSPLRERLAGAELEESSFCAVAGLTLAPVRAALRPEVSIGDALTMIPPVTGNGMSMAFESAELALAPLVAWSQGTRSWPEVQQEISRLCDQRFTRRLFWAKWLQRLILTAPLQNTLVGMMRRNDWLWRMAFEKTR
jgi:2-polyprenyl-6-methoxyphenol hydroxylase-like FAD-dependent oxidoreductase